MPDFRTADEILDFAIRREEEAAQFYVEQADKMNHPATRQVFLDFAKEEIVHKEKLTAVKNGRHPMAPPQKIANLKIADYQSASPQVGPYMTYAEMLQVAMQKEKEAFRLYSDLAAAVDSTELRTLFQGLANEEAKHKLRFELEYDKELSGEN
ncbi:MAG TPA: ferritin family protein [bacterium]|jgi:rubrerythrin